MPRLEATIQDDIERQGRRLTLKNVICPNRVLKQAEAYVRCVGVLPDGGEFTINVIQQDDQGNVVWDVPSSKMLINLAALEEKIQGKIKEAVGKPLAVDCGDTYRVNRRGDTFECDVIGAGTVASGRVVSILVNVTADNNLEWQEVLVGNAPAAIAGGTAASASKNSADATAAAGGTDSSAPKKSTEATAAEIGRGAAEGTD